MSPFTLAVRSRFVAASTPRRFIATSTRLMGAGSTGSGTSRPGGGRSGDAFTRREHASEEMYFRQEERLKLEQLRKKIQNHKEHLDDLDKSINDILNNGNGKGKSE